MSIRTTTLLIAVACMAAVLAGCGSGETAIGTAEAGKPKYAPSGEGGAMGTPNGAKKGSMAPPGV